MARRLWIAFCALVAALYIALVVVVFVQSNREARLLLATGFGVFGLVTGYATFRVAVSDLPRPVRYVAGVVLGYHALVAPVFMLYLIVADTTRNDDVPLRLYPHIVGFIDSTE